MINIDIWTPSKYVICFANIRHSFHHISIMSPLIINYSFFTRQFFNPLNKWIYSDRFFCSTQVNNLIA